MPEAGRSKDHNSADNDPLVLIVEDDEALRDSLASLLRSAGYKSLPFGSVSEFLAAELPSTVRCLIADVRLPRVSGLDLPTELARRNLSIPTIFMTGHGDIPMSVRAMKEGAVDFLAKPFRDQDMLDAVATALERDRGRRRAEGSLAELRARHDRLTQREREVLGHVATGLLNKQIAGELGLSEITVKLHRSSVMRKMGAQSLAQLIRMVEALERNSLQDPVERGG